MYAVRKKTYLISGIHCLAGQDFNLVPLNETTFAWLAEAKKIRFQIGGSSTRIEKCDETIKSCDPTIHGVQMHDEIIVVLSKNGNMKMMKGKIKVNFHIIHRRLYAK